MPKGPTSARGNTTVVDAFLLSQEKCFSLLVLDTTWAHIKALYSVESTLQCRKRNQERLSSSSSGCYRRCYKAPGSGRQLQEGQVSNKEAHFGHGP